MKVKTLDQNIVKLLVDRMRTEFAVSHFYRSASNWCNDKGFMKAGKFFLDEAEDEITHAQILNKHINDWNVLFSLPEVESPDYLFDNLLDILNQAYVIEYGLYEDYNETSVKVFQMGDIATFDILQKLRAIQNESVIVFSDKLNIADGVDANDKFQMLMIEDKLF
jgi:ferritin